MRAVKQMHTATTKSLGITVGTGVYFAGTHSPIALQQHIEAFLDASQDMLAKLPAAEFEQHRKALIAAKLQQSHSLLDESDRHWEQIQTRR